MTLPLPVVLVEQVTWTVVTLAVAVPLPPVTTQFWFEGIEKTVTA
jgi:hypothetical protein